MNTMRKLIIPLIVVVAQCQESELASTSAEQQISLRQALTDSFSSFVFGLKNSLDTLKNSQNSERIEGERDQKVNKFTFTFPISSDHVKKYIYLISDATEGSKNFLRGYMMSNVENESNVEETPCSKPKQTQTRNKQQKKNIRAKNSALDASDSSSSSSYGSYSSYYGYYSDYLSGAYSYYDYFDDDFNWDYSYSSTYSSSSDSASSDLTSSVSESSDSSLVPISSDAPEESASEEVPADNSPPDVAITDGAADAEEDASSSSSLAGMHHIHAVHPNITPAEVAANKRANLRKNQQLQQQMKQELSAAKAVPVSHMIRPAVVATDAHSAAVTAGSAALRRRQEKGPQATETEASLWKRGNAEKGVPAAAVGKEQHVFGGRLPTTSMNMLNL